MLYVQWTLLAIVDFVFKIANIFLAPIVILFQKDGWLPNWLSWFQTPDNSLDGDNGWKTEHLLWLNAKGDSFDPFRIYLKRVLWIIRNPIYGFAYFVLGKKTKTNDILAIEGDPLTTNNGHSGWCMRKLYREGKLIAFQFYYVQQYGNLPKCFRLNMGWKLWGFKNNEVDAQFVFSITPWKKFG